MFLLKRMAKFLTDVQRLLKEYQIERHEVHESCTWSSWTMAKDRCQFRPSFDTESQFSNHNEVSILQFYPILFIYLLNLFRILNK